MASRKRREESHPSSVCLFRKKAIFPRNPQQTSCDQTGGHSFIPKLVTGMEAGCLAKTSRNSIMKLSLVKEEIFEKILALLGRCGWGFGRQPTVPAQFLSVLFSLPILKVRLSPFCHRKPPLVCFPCSLSHFSAPHLLVLD